MKIGSKVKSQHYVWRYYLKTWSVKNSIWCYREGRFFNTNLMNVGQANYFYKLKDLSTQDIEFIHRVAIEPSIEYLQDLNKEWISSFNYVFDLKRYIEGSNMVDPKINEALEVAIVNLEEKLHHKIEFQSIRFIESLLNKDVSFFDIDDDRAQFIFYICVQYMRTQKIKSNVLNNVNDLHCMYDNTMEKTWNVISHILASSLGWSIYSDINPFKIVVLENNTLIELIAGDQPVINTYSIGLSINEAVENLEFYYPLSPHLAILLTQGGSYHKSEILSLSEQEVDRYNRAIIEKSHSQIYAASEEAIARYVIETT